MAKLTLVDTTNFQNETSAAAKLNENNRLIEAAVEKTLSRDGTTPNQMGAVLDMNSHRIINLEAPANPNDAVRLKDLTNAVFNGEVTIAGTDISFTQNGSDVGRTMTDKVYEMPISPEDFGCKGDWNTNTLTGTDDTVNFQRAVNAAAYSGLQLTAGKKYRIAGRIALNAPIVIKGAPGSQIVPDFPLDSPGGSLFSCLSNNITFEDIEIDGYNIGGFITGNRYAFASDPQGTTRYRDIKFNRCRFLRMSQVGSNDYTSNILVSHAILAKQVDSLRVTDCGFDDLSGSGIFMISCDDAMITRNKFNYIRWSSVWCNNNNVNFRIESNYFRGSTALNPTYFGGAIDVMGQTANGGLPGIPDRRGIIRGNHFIGGVYRYGFVCRLSSTNTAVFANNIFEDCDADLASPAGSGGIGSHNTLLQLTTRDVVLLSNGPPQRIAVTGNIFRAKGPGYQEGVLIFASTGSLLNTTPGKDYVITDNIFECPSDTDYFGSNIVVAGQSAGIRGLKIADNIFSGRPGDTGSVALLGAFPGLVAMATNLGTTVDDVSITDNVFTFFKGLTGSLANLDTNNNVAVYVGPRCTAEIHGNTFRDFYRVITIDPAAGSVPVLHNKYTIRTPNGASAYNNRGFVLTPSIGGFRKHKPTSQNIASSTTLTNVTAMVFPIGPNEEYAGEFVLNIGAALATTGMKLAVVVPSGATIETYAASTPDLVTGATRKLGGRSGTSGTAIDFTAAFLAGVGDSTAVVRFYVLNGSNAGEVQLQFAQSTSDATNLTIRQGSYLKAEQYA